MQKLLINWLKKVFSDSHSAIIGIALGSLFAGGTGIYFFAKNLWNVLTYIMQKPTPLWATIALVFLLGVYIYLKNLLLIQTFNTPQDVKNFIFTQTGIYKWKVIISKDISFKIDPTPFCVEHDMYLMKFDQGYRCGGSNSGKGCKAKLANNEYSMLYDLANGQAEKEIRNKLSKSHTTRC
ncbi:MAG: hypothetical protein KKC76_01645 [Proteobacteria bacterium]|nr:hypothetical protein [Pseudomonadota bacterium]MBU4297930.1 hypothetical protein [Pseudomonadota bacterium]MCG2747976.1 hypothetical protein [Desulfobulbaceae bacterium]